MRAADELRFFLTALGYFTRVPLPARLAQWVGFQPYYLNAAARHFPLIGLLIGVVGALVTWVAAQLWPPAVAVLLGMAATLLLTGAFHEDGLADCADAFGGGYTPEDVLRIMHDSRVGAFGAIAVVVTLLLKWQLLLAIGTDGGMALLAGVLVAAHGASRAMAITFLATHDYVRDEGKARPVAQRLAGSSLTFALVCGALPLVLLAPGFALATMVGMALLQVALGAYFVRRIGGYTGDCLGFAQQLAELLIYLVAAAWTWS
ncbi:MULTISPECIES: adenosylcobinamide-GDP ribazoletransferase [unclassified Cupriavidus]|uniref:adenosylcobinamide-GDP ribazoletransferase n=1 Tax=Cupriavidus sp. H19C3 TaxID=3241603 RepID=UPI003BF8E501